MMFHDRKAAGRLLAEKLRPFSRERCVVLALPRGGVPVAAEVAAALDAPLDLVFVQKIGAPHNPKLAVGAIVDGSTPVIVRNENLIKSLELPDALFAAAWQRSLAEIDRRHALYLGHQPSIDVHECTAIVIDDGIATGATARAALQATRKRHPRKLVLAVPVAPQSVLKNLSADADAIVCLDSPEPYRAVCDFYEEFPEVTDRDVQASLARVARGGMHEGDRHSSDPRSLHLAD